MRVLNLPLGWCSEFVTSSVNQACRHAGRNCSTVTGCHRNVPIVEKLADSERVKKEEGGRNVACQNMQVIFYKWKCMPHHCSTESFEGLNSCISFSSFSFMYPCVCGRKKGLTFGK